MALGTRQLRCEAGSHLHGGGLGKQRAQFEQLGHRVLTLHTRVLELGENLRSGGYDHEPLDAYRIT